MARRSKRYNAVVEKIAKTFGTKELWSLEEACKIIVESKSTKFDESVELAFRLGVDPRKADQNVRGSVPLPHGLGKTVRVAVFAKGDKLQEAIDAGADITGGDDLVERVKGGFLDFDSVIATPDMMVQVGKVGKTLGPKGLMPSPKIGTVTFDVGATVRAIKAGRAEYRVEKAGIVHVSVGKVSFGEQKILENVQALIQAINKAKPQTSKGVYLKSGSMCLTMGPGVDIDVAPLRAV